MNDLPEVLDLRGVPCPQNAARALMALELLDAGEHLVVAVDPGEPAENLPAALELEGHVILHIGSAGDRYRILVQRGEE